MNDTELLRAWADHRDESAFAELVHRHLNLVYAAARRQSSGLAFEGVRRRDQVRGEDKCPCFLSVVCSGCLDRLTRRRVCACCLVIASPLYLMIQRGDIPVLVGLIACLTSGWPVDASIVLTEPLPGTVFTDPALVEFTARSSAPAEEPFQLDLMTDGHMVGTLTNQLTGVWPPLSPGNHGLSVRWRADSGLVAQSISVPIFVGPAVESLPPVFSRVAVSTLPIFAYEPLVSPATVNIVAFAHDPNPEGHIVEIAMFVDDNLFSTRSGMAIFPFGLTNYSAEGTVEVVLQARNNYGALATTNITLEFRQAEFSWQLVDWDHSRPRMTWVHLDDQENTYANDGYSGIIQRLNGERVFMSTDNMRTAIMAVSANGHAAGTITPFSDDQPAQACRFVNGNVEPLVGLVNCTPVAVNRLGTILLLRIPETGPWQGVLWQEEKTRELTGFPAGSSVAPSGLNDRGDCIGTYTDADAGQRSFLWKDGSFVELARADPGIRCEPVSINTEGVVVGFVGNQAYRWSNGVLELLPMDDFEAIRPIGVNDAGWIVAAGSASARSVALIDRGHGWENLGSITPQRSPLGDFRPVAINERGAILVQSGFVNSSLLVRPIDALVTWSLMIDPSTPAYLTVNPRTMIYGVEFLNQRSSDLRRWQTWSTNLLRIPVPEIEAAHFFRVVPRR